MKKINSEQKQKYKDEFITLVEQRLTNAGIGDITETLNSDTVLFNKMMNLANALDDYDNINENTINNNDIYNKIKADTKKYGINYHKILSNIIENRITDKKTDKKPMKTNIEHIIWIYNNEPLNPLTQVCKDYNIKLDYIDINDCEYNIKDNNDIIIKSNDNTININKTDKGNNNILVLCRRGYNNDKINILLNMFIGYGLTVINRPEYVEVCSNKYKTAELLKENGIPQPNYTLITSDDIHKTDNKEFEKKLKSIYNKIDDDLVYICKILSGHGGAGVFKCRGKNILAILQCLYKLTNTTEILIQEYKEIEKGDIRVNVLTLGTKQTILNVVRRNKGDNDFRTNLSLGSTLERDIELSNEQKELALKTARLSGLTWAGIDLLPYKNKDDKDSKDSKYDKVYTDVIEINAVPGTLADRNVHDKETNDYKFWETLISNI